MPNVLLEKKVTELEELHAAVRAIQDKAADEERDLSDVEKDRIKALSEAAQKCRDEAEFLQDTVTAERSYVQLMQKIDAQRMDDGPKRPTGLPTLHHGQPGGSLDVRSWGDLIVESEAFKSYTGRGSSTGIDVPLDLEQRAPITIGGFPAAGLPPFMWTPPQHTYVSPLINAVGKVTTSSNVVSFVQWAPNPMAAADVVPEGTPKPEATMSATAQSVSLVTWAVYKEITRQAMEDIPQIRSEVENRLRQAITVAIEESILANLAAATLPPVAGSAAGGDTLLGVIRQGIATVQAAGYARPNAIVINPMDAAEIDVAIMSGTLNGPSVNGNLWGVPLVPVSGVPAGTAYVGDMSVGVTLFTRGSTTVYLTDSHGTNFINNILLLLAETRGLAPVVEPAALAECTVGA